MKTIIALFVLSLSSYVISAQSCAQTCDKKSCGPEGTKKEEAAVIKTMRTDLQTVVAKMAKSNLAFDSQVKDMTIEKGENDDESLLFLSQAATTIRYELLNKLERSKVVGPLKEFKPGAASSKQQMVANLKKEIQVLASQAEQL
jgi:hypothetical protein